MTQRENKIRAYLRIKPEYIPISFGITPMYWNFYDNTELEKLVREHKRLFPNDAQIKSKNHPLPVYLIPGNKYVDAWGCTWETAHEGMLGTVMKNPVAQWNAFGNLKMPDPDKSDGMRFDEVATDWARMKENIRKSKESGHFTGNGLEHGHTFLRLGYLRGFENLIYDMCDEEPLLTQLIEMVKMFSLERVKRLVEAEPDLIHYPEDLGTMTQSLISPELFRKYIKPVYKEITRPARDKGILIHMHSDGYILELIEDLIDVGMNVINLQDLVNGVDNLRSVIGKRITLDIDIDRQNITVFGSPKDVDDHIREIVMKLGSQEGGLSMEFQLWPPTPIENVKAIMDAMERYSFYYS